MIQAKKKQLNTGSAMIVSIVVSIVIMAFVLSLLLLSYSLFADQVAKAKQLQTKELAYSLSDEIAKELSVNFTSFDEQKQAQDAGKYGLWFKLRYGLFQDDESIVYYNPQENGHKEDQAFYYYQLNADGYGFQEKAEQTFLTLYWESSDDVWSDGVTDAAKEASVLNVIVEVFNGDAYYSNHLKFDLDVDTYVGVDESLVYTDTNSHSIKASEKWIWSQE